jgi:hypothetical protein
MARQKADYNYLIIFILANDLAYYLISESSTKISCKKVRLGKARVGWVRLG